MPPTSESRWYGAEWRFSDKEEAMEAVATMLPLLLMVIDRRRWWPPRRSGWESATSPPEHPEMRRAPNRSEALYMEAVATMLVDRA